MASRPHGAEVSRIGDLRPGDYITEVDTPEGPWYEVIALSALAVTVDGRGAGASASLPVTIGYDERSAVLRKRVGTNRRGSRDG